MPTTKGQIKKQVDRLCQLASQDPTLFGDDQVATIRAELGRALERYSSSDDEAMRAVDWLIFKRPSDTRIFRPAAGEIPEAIREVREIADRESKSPDGCPECEGQPWVTIEKIVIDYHTGQPMPRSGSRRCFCSRGQWFRAKDKENAAKRAMGQPV